MRILHMIPDIGASNGVMSVIVNYAAAMPENIIFDVVYFCETKQTREEDIKRLGGNVYKINYPAVSDLLGDKMKSFFIAHKNEWSALHIHCPHFAPFIAPSAKKAGIKKIAVHCHTETYSLEGNEKRNKILSLYAKYFIDEKFACSLKSGKMWYGNKNFTVINNAVDCSLYSYDGERRTKLKNKLSLGDSFVVSHIGKTSVSQKNHPFIIKVFSEIKKIRKDSVLLLIGADKTDELTKLCRKLSLEQSVRFLGARSDVNDLLLCSDLFLFPSLSEGLPVSVIEAQAAGLPVLMSDVITDEVAATKLVHKMSLNDSASLWAQKALSIAPRKRNGFDNELIGTDWDINKSKSKLIAFYSE